MDHLGPFVRSKRGNSYILGIIDGFSKFIFVKPVKNVKTKTTLKILRELFDIIGSPSVIISDRGTSFTSTEFKKFVDSVGAKHILNSVATPRANGQIERYNRTILESLAATNQGMDEREWDVNTGKLQWSLNNTVNKTTKKTPAEIVFGHRTINPNNDEGRLLNAIGQAQEDDTGEPSREAIRAVAEANIAKSQTSMKKQYDSKRAPTKFFSQGDLVMIPNHHNPANGKSKKLCPKFKGPFKVTAVLPNDRYEISSVKGHSKRKYKSVYPADHLKRWITFGTNEEPTTNDASVSLDPTNHVNDEDSDCSTNND